MKLHGLACIVTCAVALWSCDRTPDAPAPQPSPRPLADHVFLNGYVYTADPAGTVAEALAVRGDRIIFVGGNGEARTYVGESTRVHGLDGKMVLPGLHDTHIHLLGLVESNRCDLNSEAIPLEQMVPRLSACLEEHPLLDGWMVANQWNSALGNDPDARYSNLRAALDAVSTKVPIFLRGNDGHHAAVNSAALARAVGPDGRTSGLSAKTLRSQFRKFRQYVGVDARGEPNGSLSESARLLVRPPDVWGFSGIDAGRMGDIPLLLARSGVTSVQDAAMRPASLLLFEELARQNRMTFRMTTALYPEFEDFRDPRSGRINIDAIMDEFRRTRDHFRGHPTIKATAAKIFIDGVIEGNPFSDPPSLPNAAVLRPYRQPRYVREEIGSLELAGYADLESEACVEARQRPDKYLEAKAAAEFTAAHGIHPQQCEISYGVLEHDEAFIRNYLRALRENDFVIHAHAIGDRAVRVAVANFQALRDEFGESRLPHTIAHAQLIHPIDRKRLAKLGIYVAFTFAWVSPNFMYDLSVNPFISRIKGNNALYDLRTYAMKNLYPVRSVLEAGAVLIAGSDAPVDTRDPRPFVNIAQAVSRANPSGLVFNAGERISVHDAIAAYTRNGARALQQENMTGTIEVGKKADLIVLSQNIVELAEQGNPAGIAATEVLLTLFDGKIIYQDN